jgi:hypothetical protein
MATQIPIFYRAIFKWVDPIIATHGAYLYLFDRDTVIRSFIPNSTRNPQHDMLFYQMAGNMLSIAVLDTFLLRYTADIVVWKIVQCAVWVVDVTMLWGIYEALRDQNRLSVGALRWEDWACIGITGFAAVVRTLFVAGVGLGRSSKETTAGKKRQ